jgi:hypothetical protein
MYVCMYYVCMYNVCMYNVCMYVCMYVCMNVSIMYNVCMHVCTSMMKKDLEGFKKARHPPEYHIAKIII